ncbi:MAG TPA: hypothetical protein ENK18_21115 [Deltaproteobacteria bacterium]|nr:hypothetical protein [Deltaproteobacteria bacterium]
MARNGPGLGEELADRLMARSGGVHRRSMPDGGEVFTGNLVNHVMERVLGGNVRGFAMDGSVFMPSSFDPSQPADQATYAHERFHTMQGGEGGGFQGASPDHEESQARSIEQMVLHRAESGEDLSSIMPDIEGLDPAAVVGAQRSDGSDRGSVSSALQGSGGDKLAEGYRALRKTRSHAQVIEELKQHVVRAMERISETHAYRLGPGQ